jgi:CDP-diacylglycerol--serine O-phosphatidyltransferase
MFLPNALTLLNLALGGGALVCAVEGGFLWAALLILLAGISDTLDGRIARRLAMTSEMGKELDSLADLVSFGVAPAMLLYLQVLAPAYGSAVAYLVALAFMLCGAFRLARFNVLNISEYFVGVPITLAGGVLAAVSIAAGHLPASFIEIGRAHV